jgi:hypothetical protein
MPAFDFFFGAGDVPVGPLPPPPAGGPPSGTVGCVWPGVAAGPNDEA